MEAALALRRGKVRKALGGRNLRGRRDAELPRNQTGGAQAKLDIMEKRTRGLTQYHSAVPFADGQRVRRPVTAEKALHAHGRR